MYFQRNEKQIDFIFFCSASMLRMRLQLQDKHSFKVPFQSTFGREESSVPQLPDEVLLSVNISVSLFEQTIQMVFFIGLS